ncbi:unnamed protein product, partial [Natator depressus]
MDLEATMISPNEIERFSDFPLSNKTLKGLQEAQYRMITEIQRQTIGLSLQANAVGFADVYKIQIYKNNMKTAAPHSVTIEVLFVVCLHTLCTYFCNVNTSSQVPGRSPSLPGAQWPGPSISKISGKDIENREYKQHLLCKPAPLGGSRYSELSLIEKPFQKAKGVYNEVVSLLAHMDDQNKDKIALRIAFIAKIKRAIVLTVLLEKLQKDEQNRVDIYCVLEKVLQQDTQGLERRLLEQLITLASNHMTETQEARNELKVAASNTLVTLARCYFNDVMYELMYRLELPEEFIFITLGNLSSAY